MYTNYFGLNEVPFSIAPNPHFMFMSDRHREALAHLTYGFGETGGFALLTGEVGTGKTTISRCLLEQLPENTQVAFILNPALSAQELLATICDELKIRYRKTGATLKTLTDKIQEKLLKNHENSFNTVLIIDEAQHLQAEVLEQLRLLTNLETNTKKLLQVILIGQPELQQLLQRQDLRQLAQRITARYHLMPLNKQEVSQYIKHRLDVAKCPRMLFSPSALQQVHKITGGIPRLINLLCDRSLSIAYGTNQSIVDKSLVIKASTEVFGDFIKTHQKKSYFYQYTTWLFLTLFIVLSAVYVGHWLGQSSIVIATQSTEKNIIVTDLKTDAKTVNKDDEGLNQNKLNIPLEKHTVIENTDDVNSNIKIAEQLQRLETQLAKLNTLKNEKNVLVTPIDTSTIQTIESKPKQVPKFTVEAADGVSNELLTLFQTAIDETELLAKEDAESNQSTQKSAPQNNVKPLIDMPLWVQNEIPKLNFQMHIYASDGKGWVRVNDRERYEGDYIADGVQLLIIEPQSVVLSYRGETFSMSSLSSWD
jgi:type II secretory pathway predicted ATPase ExeA